MSGLTPYLFHDAAPPRDLPSLAFGDADELARLTRDCAASGVGRRVLWVRVSQLPSVVSRPHRRAQLRAALDPLVAADRGRLFVMPNGDFAVAWRGEAVRALETVSARAAQLLAGAADSEDVAGFFRLLELPDEAAAVVDAIAESSFAPDESPQDAGPPRLPVDTAALAGFEQALIRVDVSGFTRRRPILTRLGDGSFEPRWEKRYISVTDLMAALAPDRAADANTWLFRRMTRTLDLRMLTMLATTRELHHAGPFSLDINIASILSAEFLRFDAALPPGLRGHVILEISPADMLADPVDALFARTFVHARGYRLLLRGLTAGLLPVFTGGSEFADLLALRWSDGLKPFDAAALGTDPARIVLTHAPAAGMAWARSCGIRLFEQPRVPAPAICR
ncbi:MAG TPA: hypothetical protein VHS58_17590 [Acetobacteraceae bacterium]|nr:hypothetical protein [Acetobacteraceae bacterium]